MSPTVGILSQRVRTLLKVYPSPLTLVKYRPPWQLRSMKARSLALSTTLVSLLSSVGPTFCGMHLPMIMSPASTSVFSGTKPAALSLP